ncbi:phage portal protein [Stakelama pacifica]|nr:anti-CBASS Acb1 family protein [Stakelama pacifica]
MAGDPRTANAYAARTLSQYDIASAYRGSGLMRKIITIPPLDMVREWRDWQADGDQIKAIEAEEKRLGLKQKTRQVEVLRKLGGGALIMGLPGDMSQPAPTTIAKGGLAYIHVVNRWQLTFNRLIEDSRDPRFGEPEMYRMTTTRGQQLIHPSRVVPFRGDPSPSLLGVANYVEDFWGESTIAQVLDAVQDSDTARSAFASLITKARNLRIGIPKLSEYVATDEGEALFQRRMRNFTVSESMFNAIVYDAGDGDGKSGERIDDTTYSFGGMKDVMNAYGEWASAISDIPATRLLGRAPEGMNASGESQQEDWRKKIRAMQTLEMGPCLDRLDPYLIQSALGSANPDIWYEWAPLDTPTEAQQAETFFKISQALEKIAGLTAIPDRAFNEAVQNTLTEGGYMPGLDNALEGMSDEERFGLQSSVDPALTDPSALIEAQAASASSGKEGGQISPSTAGATANNTPRRRAANDARFVADAASKTLYVERKLLNAAEVIRWAKSQGLETTLAPDDMHVTVAYSRAAVDWFTVGEDWSSDQDGKLRVKPGGPRTVERLGDGDAVALLFQSNELQYRHDAIRNAGASWDWPDYRPHITLTLQAEGVDVDTIEPYQGPLVFGPELFSELDPDWKSGVKEQ